MFFKKIVKSNCLKTDLIILLTEWDEFKTIDFKKIVKKEKFKVYDLRNLYNVDEMRKTKLNIILLVDQISNKFKYRIYFYGYT